MTGDSSKVQEKQQRRLFRQTVHRIWEMVKSGRVDELSEKENRLAFIIMDHGEYCDHFENTDILDGREYEAGMKFNPFVHISTHQMVEDQLSSSSPIETVLFCEAMEDKGMSRHEAVHFIVMILIRVIAASAVSRQPFDAARYKRLLDACGRVEPSEVEGVIEADFSRNNYRQDLH
ncbi:MAG: DUF1841 family protein [Syntrophales bacterium]